MTTFPILALADGEIADPEWFADITAAVNSHETRLGVVEGYSSRVIRKTADQTVNNSTTLVADTDLAASATVNETYAFEYNLFMSTNSTADIKVALKWPTGAVCSWMVVGYLETSVTFQINLTSATYQTASGTAQPYGGGTDYPTMQIKGLLRMGSTAGNLALWWAQNTLNASNTTVKQDSWMRIEKVTN